MCAESVQAHWASKPQNAFKLQNKVSAANKPTTNTWTPTKFLGANEHMDPNKVSAANKPSASESMGPKQLRHLKNQLSRAVKMCGGPIEAPLIFKRKGIEFATPEIHEFLRPGLSKARAENLAPLVKQIINHDWPLSPHSLTLRNLYASNTILLTAHGLSTSYRSPYFDVLRQHLTLLIRRYNTLQNFSEQHNITPHAVLNFLDPNFIPDTQLVKHIFEIFHAENYTRLQNDHAVLQGVTKSLTEFKSHSLKIPLHHDASVSAPLHKPSTQMPNTPPQLNTATNTSAAKQPEPEYINVSLNDIPHVKKNIRHIIQHLKQLAAQFNGLKSFSLVMSQHYTFDGKKKSAKVLHNQLRALTYVYSQQPPLYEPRAPTIYFLFDLIEKATQHLSQQLNEQAPSEAVGAEEELILHLPVHNLPDHNLPDCNLPDCNLPEHHLPEHHLVLKSSDVEHIRTHIVTLTHYYRHLAFDVYKGAPNLARFLNINLTHLHRYLDIKTTPKMTDRSLKTMLKNIIQAQKLAQNKEQLKQKLQPPLPNTKVVELQIPTPQGVLTLSLEDFEHVSENRKHVQQYLRQVAQHFGGISPMMQIVHHASIAQDTVWTFLHSKNKTTQPLIYARIFELIDKALPYTKKSKKEIRLLLNTLKHSQTAASARFVLDDKEYVLNTQQGQQSLHLMQAYLKQQMQHLTDGDLALLARKIKVNEDRLRYYLGTKIHRSQQLKEATVKKMFYVIQEVQNITSPTPLSNNQKARMLKNKSSTQKTRQSKNKLKARALKNKPSGQNLEPENTPNAPDTNTPLHQAVRRGDIAHLRQVVHDHILDLNAVDPRTQETALQWAAFAGDAQAVELLLDAGASTQALTEVTGQPSIWPIEEAVRASSLSVLKVFMQHGASLDVVSDDSNLLDIALARQHFLNKKIQGDLSPYQSELYQNELKQATEVLEFLKQQGLKPLYYATHELPAKASGKVSGDKKQSPHRPASSQLATALSEPASPDNSDLKKALQEFQKFHSTWAGLLPPFDEEARLFRQLNQELAKAQAQSPTCFELLDDGHE